MGKIHNSKDSKEWLCAQNTVKGKQKTTVISTKNRVNLCVKIQMKKLKKKSGL